MASGRINRNVFPVPDSRLGEGWREHTKMVCFLCYRRSATSDRPSVTELPRLTSDFIYTADRRGEILISFGPNRIPRWVINPPEHVGPWVSSGSNRTQPRRVIPEHPRTDKGVGLGRRTEPLRCDPRTSIRVPYYT